MMNLKKRRTKLFQNGKCILKFDIKIKGKIIRFYGKNEFYVNVSIFMVFNT